MSKKEWKMGQIFVAFSEYLNLTNLTGRARDDLKSFQNNSITTYSFESFDYKLCRQNCIANSKLKAKERKSGWS